MSFKTMVVHLDNDRRCAERIELAAKLALEFDAHLTGLFLMREPEIPNYARVEIGTEYLEGRLRDWQQRQIERMSAEFSQRTAQAGVTGAEFRFDDHWPVDAIATHARYADLLILGQTDRDDENSLMEAAFPGQAVLASGRPVLLIPSVGAYPTVGKRVLVAWDAGREAARAVTDALPFLQSAAKVTVLAVNPETSTRHGAQPGADIGLFLARHGVRVEATESHAGDVDVGAWLLSRAFDLEADLIVMGGYGHSRVREMAFGGVTRTILGEMTVPVLMSH
ncbi:MAG: universal stress protein [Betaproteobacteria bacterium]|nr:universal stress protein [Betaproteobacteria bacterium]